MEMNNICSNDLVVFVQMSLNAPLLNILSGFAMHVKTLGILPLRSWGGGEWKPKIKIGAGSRDKIPSPLPHRTLTHKAQHPEPNRAGSWFFFWGGGGFYKHQPRHCPDERVSFHNKAKGEWSISGSLVLRGLIAIRLCHISTNETWKSSVLFSIPACYHSEKPFCLHLSL